MITVRRISQREIAEKLQVSQAAVSIVLNNPETRRVASSTREKILRYCQKTGYRLSSKRMNDSYAIVCDIASKATKPVYMRLIQGVQEAAHRAHKSVVVESPEVNDHFFNRIQRLDGVIVAEPLKSADIRKISRILPTVTLNNHYDELNLCSVVSDNRGGLRQAVRYLHERGHRRLTFLGYEPANPQHRSPRFYERSSGFREACHELHLEESVSNVVSLPHEGHEEGIAELIRRWNDDPQRPTAVLLMNDWIAPRLYRAAQHCGLRIPDDLSLIGFGNFDLCEMIEPTLTSIHQELEEMGHTAVELLGDVIAQQDANKPVKRIVCSTRLVERASVRDLR